MPTTTPTIKHTWLIQRLTKPSNVKFGNALMSEVFSFGGGYKNGGLSDDAMAILRKAFSFDYMGAAEFEFGAVPKALQQIAKAADDAELEATTVLVKGTREIYHPTRRKMKLEEKPVYVLAPKHLLEHATFVVRAQASDDYPRGERQLKEVSLLQNSVWAEEIAEAENPGTKKADRERRARDAESYAHTCGWLEIDNGFFFFTDRTMFENTCAIFGVTPPTPPMQ